eukprot:2013908-Pyramimonas_sp.AAC.1
MLLLVHLVDAVLLALIGRRPGCAVRPLPRPLEAGVHDAPLTAPPPRHFAASGTSPPGSCTWRPFASASSSAPPDSGALPSLGLD